VAAITSSIIVTADGHHMQQCISHAIALPTKKTICLVYKTNATIYALDHQLTALSVSSFTNIKIQHVVVITNVPKNVQQG